LEKNILDALKSIRRSESCKVTDIAEIQKYGVSLDPLVIDEEVVVSGRVPKKTKLHN
jgi:hypothetical protein